MHHLIDMIAHTIAFVRPVMEGEIRIKNGEANVEYYC